MNYLKIIKTLKKKSHQSSKGLKTDECYIIVAESDTTSDSVK
jgi:hypothetical protein